MECLFDMDVEINKMIVGDFNEYLRRYPHDVSKELYIGQMNEYKMTLWDEKILYDYNQDLHVDYYNIDKKRLDIICKYKYHVIYETVERFLGYTDEIDRSKINKNILIYYMITVPYYIHLILCAHNYTSDEINFLFSSIYKNHHNLPILSWLYRAVIDSALDWEPLSNINKYRAIKISYMKIKPCQKMYDILSSEIKYLYIHYKFWLKILFHNIHQEKILSRIYKSPIYEKNIARVIARFL